MNNKKNRTVAAIFALGALVAGLSAVDFLQSGYATSRPLVIQNNNCGAYAGNEAGNGGGGGTSILGPGYTGSGLGSGTSSAGGTDSSGGGTGATTGAGGGGGANAKTGDAGSYTGCDNSATIN